MFIYVPRNSLGLECWRTDSHIKTKNKKRIGRNKQATTHTQIKVVKMTEMKRRWSLNTGKNKKTRCRCCSACRKRHTTGRVTKFDSTTNKNNGKSVETNDKTNK